MKIRIKTRILSAALCTGLMLTACQSGTGKTESAQPAAVPTEERNVPTEETALPMEETALPSEEMSANQSGSKQPESAGDLWDLPKEASGQSGEAPGADDSGAFSSHDKQELKIGLPMNENWYSDPVYSTEEGGVRQVMFYDEFSRSDVIVRACRTEDGDPSVFYYMFDEQKKQTWMATAKDGARIEITLEVTIENSDIHGVLATWEHGGIRYALWEDDAKDAVDSAAKMAVEIAERSAV